MSSDSPENAVFGKIFVFGKNFCFLEEDWGQKWTKTENFGYVPFVFKHIILKHYSYTVFILWCNTSDPTFYKFNPYLGGKGPRSPQKGPISWLLHCHENIWKFITFGNTNARLVKLTTIMYCYKKFDLAKNWTWLIGRGRAWSKHLWKKAKKLVFRLCFLEFSGLYLKPHYMIFHFALHCWSKFEKNPTAFGGGIPKKPPKSSLKYVFLVLRKHLKVHNLATTNSILMNFNSILYVHETFHLMENWGITIRA